MRLRAGLVLAAVAAAIAATGPATAASVTGKPRIASASLGTWRATLGYASFRRAGFERIGALRLRTERSGRLVSSRSLALPSDCRAGGCTRLEVSGFRFLELRRLDGPSPTAVIWLYTGGAHCCTVLMLVPLDGRATVSRNFGDPGARFATIRGAPVLLSADPRFAYLFTSYAASGLPLQVWRLRRGRLVDVTRSYPDRVRADAAEWWRIYVRARRRGDEVRGVFAAWAADACALGRRADVERRLAEALRRGDFSGSATEGFGPRGGAYAAALRARLRTWGYCR